MLKKVEISIVYILFFLLPFHAFFVTFTNKYLTINYLRFWKEFLILILFVLWIYKIFTKKITFNFIDKLIIIYVLYMIFYSIFLSIPLLDIIIGLKYDTLFFIFFLILSSIIFDKINYQKLLNVVLHTSIPILLFGFLFYFLLPVHWLIYLGYSPNVSAWIPMKDALPIFHGIGENLDIMRIQSTFASPNYYAIYLIIIFWICVGKLLTDNIRINNCFKNWHCYYIIFVLLNLILTFSRSAIIAFMMSIIVYIYLNYKDRFTKKVLNIFYLVSLIIILFFLLIFLFDNMRISSTSGHISAIYNGLQNFLMYPFGYGLGYAGPASRYIDPNPYKHGFIVENWFLQISLEGGVIALILFIVLCWFILYFNFKYGYNKFLIYPFIVSLIMAMFLHIYEDSSTSLLLFGLLAINISNKRKLLY